MNGIKISDPLFWINFAEKWHFHQTWKIIYFGFVALKIDILGNLGEPQKGRAALFFAPVILCFLQGNQTIYFGYKY